jgi:hypothetical protein
LRAASRYRPVFRVGRRRPGTSPGHRAAHNVSMVRSDVVRAVPVRSRGGSCSTAPRGRRNTEEAPVGICQVMMLSASVLSAASAASPPAVLATRAVRRHGLFTDYQRSDIGIAASRPSCRRRAARPGPPTPLVALSLLAPARPAAAAARRPVAGVPPLPGRRPLPLFHRRPRRPRPCRTATAAARHAAPVARRPARRSPAAPAAPAFPVVPVPVVPPTPAALLVPPHRPAPAPAPAVPSRRRPGPRPSEPSTRRQPRTHPGGERASPLIIIVSVIVVSKWSRYWL